MTSLGKEKSYTPSIRVFSSSDEKIQEEIFTASFRIGRDPSSEVLVADPVVSRHHAEVVFIGGKWWLKDLGSGNGTWVNGHRIDRIPLEGKIEVELGFGGPRLSFIVEPPPAEEDSLSLTHYRDHYFKDDGEAGERTIMVRRAFAREQKKQRNKYGTIIAVVTLLFMVAGSMAIYKHLQVTKQKELAGEIFYAMKAQEIEFSDLLRVARESKDRATLAKVEQYKQKARELEESYSKFVENLGIYEKKISPQKRIILKMARTFGECEVLMPDDFAEEVMCYIHRWKSTKRFSRAIHRAEERGYITPIARTMLHADLPPQLLYLALQESNFDVNACGPKTRWGIAKGMWQFIPSTATYYGLSTGPLVDYRKPDPRDERHDFAKSTRAAARYLRAIYDTDAQASGLLVIASYNWGENRVNRLIKAMPDNPKERNFWRFLQQYRDKIPKQTYDYVFMIFSAAVIGENPRLFGFDFDNPLAAIQT